MRSYQGFVKVGVAPYVSASDCRSVSAGIRLADAVVQAESQRW
jgi:hypothetical protein